MDAPEAAITGVFNMLMQRHAADIERLAVARTLGFSTRVWWDSEAESLRFEVIDLGRADEPEDAPAQPA